MNNNITDQYIIDLFFTNGHINSNYNRDSWLNKHPEIKEYLNNRYKDSLSRQETLYRILCNIEKRPTCVICGKPVVFEAGHRFNRNRNGWPFLLHCSPKCQRLNTDVTLKRKNTCIKKYGVDNPIKSEDIQKQISKTNLKRYGSENVFASQKIKDKIKATNLKRYGVEYNLAKLDLDSSVDSKIKERYIKMHNNVINGVINKYHTTLYAKTEECQLKIYNTKKKNKSFNTSNPEEYLYKILLNNFKDVKRQYKSNEYPYMCDFYIPTYNMYIELNFNWTHGYHPYNKNDENDIKRKIYLEDKYKATNKPYYKTALNIWTNTDLNKINIAKTNNIKYLCIYNKTNLDNIISIIEDCNKSDNKILISGI